MIKALKSKLSVLKAEKRLDKYCNGRFTEEQEGYTNLYTEQYVTYRTGNLSISIDINTGKITEHGRTA